VRTLDAQLVQLLLDQVERWLETGGW